MNRFALAAFLALAAATIAAFFIVQHLKVSTPFLSGVRRPRPGEINPLINRTCYDRAHHEKLGPRTVIAFYLLHATDRVDVYVVNQAGVRVATLASDRFMKASLFPHEVRTFFSWNGRGQNGSIAPNGDYYFIVHLIHQDRNVTISGSDGPFPVIVNAAARCA
jgi:hypothetical protein